MEEEKIVTTSQANEAESYIQSYYKMMFGRVMFADEWPDEEKDIPKFWPEDVKEAWRTCDAWSKYISQERIDV